jgi:two-component system, LuxR family, response regulator FixJ
VDSEPQIHVIDDDDAARDALAFLLGTASYSVREHGSARAFLDVIAGMQAGCIITDIRMSDISGLDLLHRLKKLGIAWPVIVVTGESDLSVVAEAIKSGAANFIEKPYAAEELLAAVEAAINAEDGAARDQEKAAIAQRLATLSAEEHVVLRELADGRSNETIARDQGRSVHSIEIHRANVMTKMQATSLSQLIRMALNAGS